MMNDKQKDAVRVDNGWRKCTRKNVNDSEFVVDIYWQELRERNVEGGKQNFIEKWKKNDKVRYQKRGGKDERRIIEKKAKFKKNGEEIYKVKVVISTERIQTEEIIQCKRSSGGSLLIIL